MRPWEPLQSLNSLSVTQIAELSKFSKSYISQVKHGKCPPSAKLLEVLKSHHHRIQTEHDYFTIFLRSRKAMEVSPGTEQFYRIKLGRFLSEVNADKAQRQDIETFLLQFENPGNRHAYYRAIKTFYNWREETFDLPSPMAKIKAPRLGKRLTSSTGLITSVTRPSSLCLLKAGCVSVSCPVSGRKTSTGRGRPSGSWVRAGKRRWLHWAASCPVTRTFSEEPLPAC